MNIIKIAIISKLTTEPDFTVQLMISISLKTLLGDLKKHRDRLH